jgi:hypothetical protein
MTKQEPSNPVIWLRDDVELVDSATLSQVLQDEPDMIAVRRFVVPLQERAAALRCRSVARYRSLVRFLEANAGTSLEALGSLGGSQCGRARRRTATSRR